MWMQMAGTRDDGRREVLVSSGASVDYLTLDISIRRVDTEYMIKPYAIQTVPYHENGTMGFSLRGLIGGLAGKSAGEYPDGFEVLYQDGREPFDFDASRICHGTLEDIENTKARLKKKGQGYVDSFVHWSEATMESQARYVEMWKRWAREEFTDEEIEDNRNKTDLVWMSGDELDAWEADHIAGRK